MMCDNIKKGCEIGKNPPTANFKLTPCKYCGEFRWVKLTFGKPTNLSCNKCSNIIKGHTLGLSNIGNKPSEETKRRMSESHTGARNSVWKGGRTLTKDYMQVKIYPDHPYYPMANASGYILEHRLVVAEAIGRCLRSDELVHHINEVITDNRIENLELSTWQLHILIHKPGFLH